MVISSTQRQMNENLVANWQAYLEKLKEAEDMLDNSKDTFKLALLAEAEEIKEAAVKLAEKLLTMPTSTET